MIQQISEMEILFSKDQLMEFLTQIYIQLIIMFMEAGTIKNGTQLCKMDQNIDFTDFSE